MSNIPDWAFRLRTERRNRMWTQRDMARTLAEVAEGFRERLPARDSLVRMVRDWEAGRHQPKDPYRVLYARAFGLNEDDLFDERASPAGEVRRGGPAGSRRKYDGNLPIELTSFVGRRQEIDEVKRLLSQAALVTLTGSGGVGKTRLALRVAHELRQTFRDGVWLVTLGDLSDPGLLAATVAGALGIHDYSTHGLMTTLTTFLQRSHLLLVLDNCEHLVDACAAFTRAVLPLSPNLRILATSRQSLGAPGEQTWAVPALCVPDLQAISGASGGWRNGVQPAQVASFDSLQLFTERAQAVHPNFEITPGNVMAVARICRRLDGIPLALELAAVRLRSLSAEQVLHRLDNRFRLLTLGDRAAVPRHKTLQALIDWSYDHCTDPERNLWEQAAVFAGGFDLTAAEEVCAEEGITTEETQRLVNALVDKSILSVSRDAGGVRYRMLETIRAYGHDRLIASGRQEVLRRRHRDYYQQVTETASRQWFGPDQAVWLARLQSEHANLQAALEFCLTEPDQVQVALKIAVDMRYFFWCGHLSEGRRWFSRALETAEPTSARAAALFVNTFMACLQGDIRAAKQLVEECRSLGGNLGDRSALAGADSAAGWIAVITGDPASGVPLLEKSFTGHMALGEMEFATLSRRNLSCAVYMCGDADRAIALCEETMAMCRAHDELWSLSWTLLLHCFLMWSKGDRRSTIASASECLRIQSDLNDRTAIGHGLEHLSWAVAADDPRCAARLMGAAHGILQIIGAPLLPILQEDHDRCAAAVRAALGDAEFTAMFESGTALTVEEALAEALDKS